MHRVDEYGSGIANSPARSPQRNGSLTAPLRNTHSVLVRVGNDKSGMAVTQSSKVSPRIAASQVDGELMIREPRASTSKTAIGTVKARRLPFNDTSGRIAERRWYSAINKTVDASKSFMARLYHACQLDQSSRNPFQFSRDAAHR